MKKLFSHTKCNSLHYAVLTASIILFVILSVLPSSAARVSYYQTNKTNVPNWSSASSKSRKVRVYPHSGTVVKVVDSTINSSGNLWYKLSDGTWIFSDNLKKHSHTYNSGGYCNGRNCGYEWPYTISSASGTYQVVNSNGAKIWSRPYSNNSTHYRTLSNGTTLTINGKTQNKEGNIWYRLTDGSWVFSGNVKKRFSISFNANGGSGVPSSQYVLTGTKVTLSTNKPTRIGYVFQGWATSSNAKVAQYYGGKSYNVSDNVTLYAVWMKCSHKYEGGYCTICDYQWPYSVSSYSGTFQVVNSNGAKVWSRPYSKKSTHIRTSSKGTLLTIVGKTTNEEKHVWYKLSDGYWVYSENVKQRFALTFNANGGSGAPSTQYTLAGCKVTLSSTKPTRVGYVFQGWATSSVSKTARYQGGKSYGVSENTTLYAVWKQCSHRSYSGGYCSSCGYEYPISVSAFSGIYVVTNNSGAKVWTRPYSNKAAHIRTEKKNVVLTVVGKTTNAEKNVWYKLPDGNWLYSGNVTQRFTVNYNVNGATSGTPTSKTYLKGNSFTVSAIKPVRAGYIFQGWSESQKATKASYKSGNSYKVTKDITLYAIWKACGEHNYKKNGGICKKCAFEYVSKYTTVSGQIYVKTKKGVPVYTRPYSENSKKVRTENYKRVLSVVGYCKNQKDETWYKLADGNWASAENVTRRYTVNFDAKGGTGAPKTQAFLSGKNITISKTKPKLSGYIFLGWDTSKDAMKVVYKPGVKYSKKANLTLYAVWSRNGVDPATEILPVNALSLNELEKMYSAGERVNANALPQRINYRDASGKAIGYYISSNGCTWYAIARYNYVNKVENPLKFSSAGGNANNWVNSIDRSYFNVRHTSDQSAIKSNTIGVSTVSSTKYDSGNHVVYVECVNNGYVYYTEGSWPKPVSTFGYVKKKSVNDFAAEYEYIISAKLQ